MFEDSHPTAIFCDNIQVRDNFEYLKNIRQKFQKNDLKDFFVKVICLNFGELSVDNILYWYETLFVNLWNIREDYRDNRVWWSYAFFQ